MSNTVLLLIESSNAPRFRLDQALILADYTVLGPARSINESKRFLAENHIDLIILHLEPSGATDGDETAEEIQRYTDIPIIIASSAPSALLPDRLEHPIPRINLSTVISDEKLVNTIETTLHRHHQKGKGEGAQATQRDTEESHNHSYNNSPSARFRTRLDGKPLEVNQEMARILDSDASKQAINNFADLASRLAVPPTRHEELITLLEDTGEVKDFKYELTNSNGETLWLAVSMRLTHLIGRKEQPDKHVVEGFAVVITKYNKAEQILKRSEETFRSLAESSRDYIFRFDRHCKLTYINPAALELSGRQLHEIIGMSLRESGYSESQQNFWEKKIRQVFATAKPYQTELAFKRGRHKIYLNMRLMPEFDTAGRVISVLEVSRDITEHKQIENIQSFLAQTSAGCSGKPFLDKLVKFLGKSLSTDFVCLARFPDGHSAARPITVWYDNHFQTDWPCASQNGPCSETTNTATCCCPAQAHQSFPTSKCVQQLQAESYIGTVLRGHGKQPLGLLTVIGRKPLTDCTVAKDTVNILAMRVADELEHMESTEALCQSETKYRRLVDTARIGIWELDEQWQTVFVNPCIAEMLGYTPDEMLGQSLDAFVHEDEHGDLAPRKQQRMLGAEEHFERKFRCKDGSAIWTMVSTAALLDGQGNFTGTTAIISDISERKRAEEARRRSEALVRKKLQAILEPEGDISTLELADIIDSKALQKMIEDFYRITPIGISILDNQGGALASVGWKDICSKFDHDDRTIHQKCQKKIVQFAKTISSGTFSSYRCPNNLWCVITPIEISGQHLGYVCLGQFLYEDEILNIDTLRVQAQQNGLNQAKYLASLANAPHWSRETVDAAMAFFTNLSQIISSLSISTIKLSRTLAQQENTLRQLDESTAFQDLLVETIPMPIFYKDTQGRYLGCNKTCEKFYGKTRTQLQKLNDFDLHPVELARTLHAQDIELVAHPGTQAYETKMRDAQHAQRDVIIHKATLTDSHGSIVGLIGMLIDITDRKKAEKERQELQTQLVQAQKMEAIGTLAGGIAHDFNNILGAILGFAEMARENCPAEGPIVEYLDQVVKASNRAKELVRQILAFSRQSETEKAIIQPLTIVREALNLLRATLPSTITFQQDLNPQTSLIKADPTQIQQLVINLCTNAYHAMENKGDTLSISLGNEVLLPKDLIAYPHIQPGNFIRLTIQDNGEGITPEVKEHIFDPYFTTKKAEKGSGMGLAIVHGIVKASNGFITCHSQVGIGTTFTVNLPAVEYKAPKKTEAQDMIPVGTGHILFVDDEVPLAKMAEIMLVDLGYSVTVQTNSHDALNTFSAQPEAFDLVITDQTMPGMTGLQLAQAILDTRAEMPIILCTGYNDPVLENTAKTMGIKCLALKPFNKFEIATLIRKTIR